VRKYGGVNKIKMITNKIGNGWLGNRVAIITFDEAVNHDGAALKSELNLCLLSLYR